MTQLGWVEARRRHGTLRTSGLLPLLGGHVAPYLMGMDTQGPGLFQ